MERVSMYTANSRETLIPEEHCIEIFPNQDNSLDIISEYLEFIHIERMCFKMSEEEVCDITNAVDEMVNRLLEEVYKIDKRFKMSKVNLVGSMAEGTKIKDPNEFDFLVAIDSLSDVKGVKYLRQCRPEEFFVHIDINNASEDVRKEWADLIENGELIAQKIVDKFRGLLRIAIKTLHTKKYDKIEKCTGELSIRFLGNRRTGPCTESIFCWRTSDAAKNMRISVDITPTIKCKDMTLIDKEEVPSEIFYNRLMDLNEFLLVNGGRKDVCTGSKCFRLGNTLVELELVKGLSDNHKKCYRIIKHIFKTSMTLDNYLSISSYSLKTLVLNHAYTGNCSLENIGQCVFSIIDDLEKLLTDKPENGIFLPYFYSFKTNIFSRHASKTNIISRNIPHKTCLRSVRSVRKLLMKIQKTNFSDNAQERTMQFQKCKTESLQNRYSSIQDYIVFAVSLPFYIFVIWAIVMIAKTGNFIYIVTIPICMILFSVLAGCYQSFINR